jgi:hypothetical protein
MRPFRSFETFFWRRTTMAKKRKKLTGDERAKLRAGLEDVQRDVRELIEFLQAKLSPKQG